MKTSDLRLGNLLMNSYSEEPEAVDCITTNRGLKDIQFCVNGEVIDFFKPIPLTEEWLLKFGFEQLDDDADIMYYQRGHFGINTWMDNSKFWMRSCTPSPTIQYVHQLQNLYFALTGEELKSKD